MSFATLARRARGTRPRGRAPTRLLLVASLLPGVAACSDPLPLYTPGAELRLTVTLREPGVEPEPVARTVYRVEALLRHDTRPEFARRVSSDELRVGGATLRPTRRRAGELQYAAEVALPAGFTSAGIAVERVPAVDGLATPAFDQRLAGVRRLDPDTVVVPNGADLRLHLALPHGDGALAAPRWQLDVLGSGALPPLRVAAVSGSPPATIVVPRELLPASPRPLVLQLQYHTMIQQGYAPLDTSYRVVATATTVVRWIVRLEDAP